LRLVILFPKKLGSQSESNMKSCLVSHTNIASY
jgi:hypothetical protein